MTTSPTQTPIPAVNTAAQTNGTASGFVPKERTPAPQPTPYVAQGKPVDAQGKTEDDRKKEQQEAEAKKKKESEGNWWDQNKDWLIPILAALIGGALGYTLSKLIGDQNAAAVNTLVSNIDLDKKQDQPVQQEGATQALAAAGTQTPTIDPTTNAQNGAQAAIATTSQGRC